MHVVSHISGARFTITPGLLSRRSAFGPVGLPDLKELVIYPLRSPASRPGAVMYSAEILRGRLIEICELLSDVVKQKPGYLPRYSRKVTLSYDRDQADMSNSESPTGSTDGSQDPSDAPTF